MKALKKLLAIVLTVCILVGMPLSIDVSAIGRHPGFPASFGLKQAVVIPDSWNTGLPSGKAIALYFAGGNVTIDIDRVGAVVAVLTSGHENLVGSEGEVTHNGSEALAVWTAEIGELSTTGGNDYYVLLNGPKNKTVADIVDYCNRTYTNCYVAVRLYDKMAGDPTDFGTGSSGNDVGGQNKDGVINGIVNANDQAALASSYYCHWNGHSWGATNPDNNARDAFDIAVTTTDSADTFKLVSATYAPVAGELTVAYSHEFCYCYGGDWAYQAHFRAVTANGEFLYTDGNGNYKPESQVMPGDGYTVVGTQHQHDALGSGDPQNHKVYLSVKLSDAGKTAYTNSVNAASAYGNGSYAAFVTFEQEDQLSANNGEAAKNGFVDTAWHSHGNPTKPLLATHSTYGDRAIVKIEEAVEIVRAEVLHDEGQADKIVATFSKPMESMGAYNAIRVSADGNWCWNNGKHVQWDCWLSQYNASGTQWIGTLVNGQGHTLANGDSIDTWAEIQQYLVEQNVATMNGGQFAMNSGYRVEFLLEGGDREHDAIVENAKATDGSGLYAGNISVGSDNLFSTRGVCPITDNGMQTLKITDVDVFAEQFMLVYFNQDLAEIDNKDWMYTALAVIDTTNDQLVLENGSDPLQGNVEMSYFGNSKRILLGTMTEKSYSSLKEKCDALNAQSAADGGSANRYEIKLRLQDHRKNMDAQSIESTIFVDGYRGVTGSQAKIVANDQGWTTLNVGLDIGNIITVPSAAVIVNETTVRVTFNEPVALNLENIEVWMTRYEPNGGDAKFNTGKTIWQRQIDTSTFTPVDENGNAIEGGVSQYWQFTVDKQQLRDAVSIMHADNYVTQDAINDVIGFRFENRSTLMRPYFEGITSADGKHILKSNSSEADYRYFFPLDTATAPFTVESVTIESAKMIDNLSLEVKFSKPVQYTKGAQVMIQVTTPDNMINAWAEIGNTFTAVNPDGGYADTWVMKLTADNGYWYGDGDQLDGFANWYFNNDVGWRNATTRLALAIRDYQPDGSYSYTAMGDGLITNITDKDGNHLLAATYNPNAVNPNRDTEMAIYDITNDPFFEMESNVITAEQVNDGTHFLINTPTMFKFGATKQIRVYNGSTLVKIDGRDAVWTVGGSFDLTQINNTFSAYLIPDFGCYSIADIEELLHRENITYTTIGLALVDTTFPGDGKICNVSGRQGANNDIKQLKTTPAYCSATEDVALIELADNGKEMVVITDISIYDDPRSPWGDKNVILTFSHDIDINKLLAAKPQFWLTITGVDQVNGWTLADDGVNPIGHVQISPDSLQRYSNSNNKIVGAISGTGYDIMMNQLALLGADYAVKLRIEGAVGTGAEGKLAADNINALDPNVLSTLKTEVWDAANGRVWMNKTTNAGSYFVIDSAEITDKSTVTVRFEDPAGNPVQVYNTVSSNQTGYVSIRLTDAQGTLLNWTNIDNGSPAETLHLQHNGTFVPTEDRSVWTFTLSDKSIDLYDMYAAAVAQAEIAQLTDYRVNFCIERQPWTNGMTNYIDNLTTEDGKCVLYNDTTTTASPRAFVDLTLPVGCTESDKAVTILADSYRMLNENQFSFTFSEAVTIDTANMYIGLRVIDSQDRLVFKAADGTPAQYLLADGTHTIYEWTLTDPTSEKIFNSPLQWNGYLTDSGDGKTWIFTLSDAAKGVGNLVDIMQLFEAEYQAAGYRLELALQDNVGVYRDGVIATVASVATGRKLINNASQAHGTVNNYRVETKPDEWVDLTGYTGLSADGYYLPISVSADYQRELTMDKVEQLSKNELLVTFSEAVTIDTEVPYMALRMVDANDRLIWANRDATGTKASLGMVNGASNTAMQWSAIGWKYANDDETSADYHKQIIVSFAQTMDIANLIDKDNFPEALKGYEIKFGIEEGNGERGPQFGANGRVQGVTGTAGQQLTATLLSGRDGAYRAIDPTTVLTPDTVITVSDAKISAENQVTFKFSHSVNLGVGGTYTAFFRYVDQTGVLYGNEADGYMQIGAYLNYTDETFTTMTAHLVPDTKWGVYDMDDILNPAGALKEYMDAHPGKWVVCLEETGQTNMGLIDTFGGKDGHIIEAGPMIAGWNDGLYLDITGTPITGELNVTGVEIISDTQVKITFSAPVAYKQVDGKDSTPFVSMRLYNADKKLLFWNPYTEEYTTVETMYDKDGNRVYENQNGYTLESEGYDDKGVWVPYLAMKNQAMQWVGTPQWGDDAHTTIIYTLSGGAQLPIQNLTDILTYDFSVFGEGAFLGFDIEENTPAMISSNGHVDNIVRADNANIALDANFFPHNRDSVMVTLENIKVAYKPYKITSKTQIISDTQIRVSFSEPVVIENSPFMAIRMIDKNGDLMWSGKENFSTPYQWYGDWEWENESHTSLIWTMHSGILGGKTIYELANWSGVLQKYKNEGTWMFVIEELDNSKNEFTVGRFNNLVDNVTSKDGTVHLQSTYSKGLDGVLTKLNVEDLIGPEIELLSAQAIDDQTIKLTFTEAVDIDDTVSMGVRYLSASGDSEVLTDGKTANFKGDWKYADDSKKVIIWTLNSKHADNLTDIINYNGKFEWNKGARVAFVIMDDEDNQATPSAMRINGIYDLTNGFRRLKANYATSDYPMTQMNIEILYDIPAPEASGDSVGDVLYITNYVPYIVASAVMALAGLVVAVILYKKRKKNQ